MITESLEQALAATRWGASLAPEQLARVAAESSEVVVPANGYVCRNGEPVASARIDATMPQHGHGMNYRPKIEVLGDGRFRAVGLLLHMPGDWRLSFHISGHGATEALHAALRVD